MIQGNFGPGDTMIWASWAMELHGTNLLPESILVIWSMANIWLVTDYELRIYFSTGISGKVKKVHAKILT